MKKLIFIFAMTLVSAKCSFGEINSEFIQNAIKSEKHISSTQLTWVLKRPIFGRPETRTDKIYCDNVNDIVKQEENVDNGDHSVIVWSKYSTKSITRIHSAKDPSITLGRVQVQDPTWPLPWPYGIIQGQQWSSYANSIEQGKLAIVSLSSNIKTGISVLRLKSTDKKVKNIDITADTKHSFAIQHIAITDSETNLALYDWTLAYKNDKFDELMPSSIVLTNYVGGKAGPRFTYSILSAKVNAPLSVADLDLGTYPSGYNVQDNRFTPPLVYVQGRKQYTDKELFELAKNRSLLPMASPGDNQIPKKNGGRKLIIVVIGILFLTSGLFMMKRGNRSQTA